MAELAKKQLENLQEIGKKLDKKIKPRALSGAVVWRKGSARLIDYGVDAQLPPIILIPSLINRAYILDLDEDRSIAKQLAKVSSPLLLDWGNPGDFESGFDTAEYVKQILIPAILYINQVTNKPLHLMGYCMGGVLALGAASIIHEKIASLGLFATPWDFMSKDSNVPKLEKHVVEAIEQAISVLPIFPDEFIQSIFYLQNMEIMLQKYERFLHMDDSSSAYAEFIALEQWVRDGVPITSKVALDCFINWPQRNTLKNGQWLAKPENLDHPTFIAAPKNDQIVPNGSAKALYEIMPQAKLIEPDSGHVGMIIGSKAKKDCISPYIKFLAALQQG